MSGDISNIQHMVSRLQAADKIQQANKEEPLIEQKVLDNEHLKKNIDERETVQQTTKSDEDVKITDENAGGQNQKQKEKNKKEAVEEENDTEDDSGEHIVDIKV